MAQIPFPGSAVDGSTFFHEDTVCVYHAVSNTWECRAISTNTPQPANQNVYMTTSRVYTLADKRTEWQAKLGTGGISFALPTVRTQEEVNDAILDLVCYINAGPTYSVDYATEQWVQSNYAPLVHNHNYAATNHVHAGYATEAYVNQQIAAIPQVSLPADVPTRSEFNALVTTVMAAVANSANSGY